MIAKLLLLLATLWNGPMPPVVKPIGFCRINICGLWESRDGYHYAAMPPTFELGVARKEPNDQPHHD